MAQLSKLDPILAIVLTVLSLLVFSLWAPAGLIRTASARVGADTLVWTAALLLGVGAVSSCCTAVAAGARRRRERLRRDEELAQAMALSFYDRESLEGALALTGMGQRVESERQVLLGQSSRLALIAAALLAMALGAVVLAYEQPCMVIGALRAFAASTAAAGVLLAFARQVSRAAGTLEPTAEQIRAAVVRHHERQEAELQQARAAGALVEIPLPARTRTPQAA